MDNCKWMSIIDTFVTEFIHAVRMYATSNLYESGGPYGFAGGLIIGAGWHGVEWLYDNKPPNNSRINEINSYRINSGYE